MLIKESLLDSFNNFNIVDFGSSNGASFSLFDIAKFLIILANLLICNMSKYSLSFYLYVIMGEVNGLFIGKTCKVQKQPV